MRQLQFRAMGCQMLAATDVESLAASRLLARTPDWFSEWEQRLSRFRADSELNQLNRSGGRPFRVSDVLWEVVQAALGAERASDGLVDPTLLAALEAAGYDRTFEEVAARTRTEGPRLSTEGKGARRSALVLGRSAVVCDGVKRTVTLRHGARLDLGGIAKGYSIDLAVEALRAAGCAGGMVDIGGDVRTFGRPDDDEHWEIAVQDPFRQGTLLVLSLNDAAVCTSGNYMRFAEIQGHRYSHIIDPRSGWPAEATPSVTIIGPEATGTDALATAVSVLGPDKGLQLVKGQPGYEAMVVVGEPGSFRMIESDGFARYVHK